MKKNLLSKKDEKAQSRNIAQVKSATLNSVDDTTQIGSIVLNDARSNQMSSLE